MENPDDITIWAEFFAFYREVIMPHAVAYEGTLEQYLCALLRLVNNHSDAQFTWSLFAKLLFEAFSAEPLPFDEAWLAYTKPPIPERPEQGAYERAQEMLMYQIADLHKMRDVGILDRPAHELFFYGAKLRTGEKWTNVDIVGLLDCAHPTNYTPQPNQDRDCDWDTFVWHLWYGQIRE
ncbi:MAG: hypothetical protein K8S97_13340 [Anaerolineae bacterium]|nr:hypothetical protein [Anaerolineae bacterium]